MSAKDNLQLQMFMPVHQVRAMDLNPGETAGSDTSKVWDKALAESKDTYGGSNGSLYDNVKADGVKRPVHMGIRKGVQTLANGKHRIAAQADINSAAEVPVVHHENMVHAIWAGDRDEKRYDRDTGAPLPGD